MKILITGHQGFIGQNMTQALQDHDLAFYEWGEAMPRIQGLDWVVHLGAISSTTERNIEKIMTQNYDFSVWLLDQCVAHHVNLQYASSASVYGLNRDFAETAPMDPRNPYAWSKYLFDRHVTTQLRLGKINTSVVQGFRYFNVHGPHEDHKGSQASPHHQFAKQHADHGRIRVFENSHQYLRDFVPVEQVCQTHRAFFTVTESGIWNVGTGKPMSFLDVASQISSNIEFIPMPAVLKDNYQSYTCANMTNMNIAINKYRLDINIST